ncbi:MAG: GatB/YqeY domain-containing protein [Patescibacteria group bacterium]
MSLAQKLRDDLKEAIHGGDKERLSTLRLLFAAIQNKEIEERKKDVGLGDDEVLQVIQREVKKRKDAVTEFEKGGRPELAAQEAREAAILGVYLPAELPDEEIMRIVQDGIRESGATGVESFGVLMKTITPTLKGRASGERISRLAREALVKLS